jgi:signal transduction histidine kinase
MLVWLGLQLLRRDRALLVQREFERRQSAGQAVARSLEQSLASAERVLAGGPVPDGRLRVSILPTGLAVEPAARILWLPEMPPWCRQSRGCFWRLNDSSTKAARNAANRRRSFYGTLGRNIERLHALVESLLDFSRMEGASLMTSNS